MMLIPEAGAAVALCVIKAQLSSLHDAVPTMVNGLAGAWVKVG